MDADNPSRLEAQADAAMAQREYLAALRLYDRLIGLGNASAGVWQKTGDALLAVNEFAQAIGAFERATELAPDSPAAHHNLARAYYTMGQADRAIAGLKTTTALTSEIDPWLALATTSPNAPSATHADVLEYRCEFASRMASTHPATRRRVATTSGRSLRVGYLSAHFAGRNYMKPVWALMNHHDRSQFEIHLLSDAPVSADFAGYQAHPGDAIHDVSRLSDTQLVQHIDKLELDLLVDLSGYSHPSRASFFTRKVAPVTIAWFNMFATSGLPGIDYIVGDRHVVLPEEEVFYSERVLRLPLSYLTFQVDYPVPDVTPPPCVSTGRFSFGSLVSQYKLTPPVIDTWAEILRQCPTARLVLSNSTLKSPHNRSFLVDEFKRRGVDPERLTILPPTDHDSFLRYYEQIDLALDAFPYSGGTTTMEAIWQGVPVVTHEGDRWAARTSKTLLRECHLGDFVANDEQEYVSLAVAWSSDTSSWSRLAALRESMRDTLRASSVCDGAALAKAMEVIYRSVCQASPDPA